MCAVEYMIKADVMWRKSVDMQSEMHRKSLEAHSERRLSERKSSKESVGSFERKKEVDEHKETDRDAQTEVEDSRGTGFKMHMTEAQQISELLRGGAGMSRRMSFCWPHLMDSCARGDYEGIMKLIANGADFSIKSEQLFQILFSTFSLLNPIFSFSSSFFFQILQPRMDQLR